MTTAADLVEETRRYLYSSHREQLNTLVNAQDADDLTFTFSFDLGPLQAGSYLSIDLEILYVTSVSPQNKTAVVMRGMLGSTAASHTAGAIVYINSQFPGFSIFQALNADLNDLCAPDNGLYRVATLSITYNPAIQGYNLDATDIIDILQVTTDVAGPSQNWVALNSWRLDTAASTADFASGHSITLQETGSAGLPFRVTYSAPFVPFTALTDNVTVTGLPVSAYDLPPLGAGLRLTGVKEIQRNFTDAQGDTRRASEVPPNAQLAGYQALARERQRRIKAEANKLASTWPHRRRGI